jgi:hypothetical protein
MIPNFKGCFEYNPASDPLKGLSKEDKDQFAFEYMQMWIKKGFDEYLVMFESGDAQLMAYALGDVIDSDTCYPSCKMIERRIERWAKIFRKLPKNKRDARLRYAFKRCMVVYCLSCGYIQFPNHHNYEINKKTLDKACWECGAPNVKVEKWKENSQK